jgi:hypothetical protein
MSSLRLVLALHLSAVLTLHGCAPRERDETAAPAILAPRERSARTTDTASATLESLPWPERMSLERAIAEGDPRHAPTVFGGAAELTAGGVRVSVASDAHLSVGEHGASMHATSFSRAGAMIALSEVDAEIRGVEVRAERAPGIVEWWRSLPSGLEHGVTLAARPLGEGMLELTLEVTGLRTRNAGDDIELVHDGEAVATYAHLVVADATGATLPAHMHATETGIAITVDDARAVYPVVIDPLLVAAREAALTPADGEGNDRFGCAVALSSSGDRALVGACFDRTTAGEGAGTARVFVRSGATWTAEATLVHPDGAEGDRFGSAVALSASGDRALIGDPNDRDASLDRLGSAHVFVRTGSTWARETTFSGTGFGAVELGAAVALTSLGDRALVGAPGDGVGGRVRVYARAGSTWTLEATLAAPDGAAGDGMGTAVAFDGNGTRALLGAPTDTTSAGAVAGSARMFARAGTTWTQEAALVAPDGAAGDQFGQSVALSSTGDRALVGARFDDTPGTSDAGSARVFSRSGTTWAQEATLVAPSPEVGGYFGESVALSATGERAIVGAPFLDLPGAPNGGAADVYLRTGTSWAHGARLVDSMPSSSGGFGNVVAVTSAGDRALVGRYFEATVIHADVGRAQVFTFRAADANGAACTSGLSCVSGFCADGVCCNSACGGGSPTDCQACSAALTGGAAGICAALSSTAAEMVTCRASAGDCDVAETCTAGSTTCPAMDARRGAGAVCRAPASLCDAEETCDGTSVACPANAPAADGTECRASAGSCDAAEACDGTSYACPADVRIPGGVVCRAPTGACDAQEACDGVTAGCPLDAFLTAAVVCRAPVGTCDVEDRCTGTRADCPDVLVSAGTECEPSSGEVCDAPDVCTGTSADCMPTFLSGTECRASTAGCDPAEVCSGGAASCPPDQLAVSGSVCRASTESCDPAESCDGASASCPADETTCGPRTDGGNADAGASPDAGAPPAAAAGCSCGASAGGGWHGLTLLALLLIALAYRHR